MPEKRIAFPSGRHCGFVASVDRRVIRCASPPLARSSTYTCVASSPSRLALNAILRLSGLQSTPPSPPLVFVRRRGSALPSLGTSQRSLTCSPSVYDGSVTLKTIQRPSGLIAGELMRFMRKTSSWVIVWRLVCCAVSGDASQVRHAKSWIGRTAFIRLSPVDVGPRYGNPESAMRVTRASKPEEIAQLHEHRVIGPREPAKAERVVVQHVAAVSRKHDRPGDRLIAQQRIDVEEIGGTRGGTSGAAARPGNQNRGARAGVIAQRIGLVLDVLAHQPDEQRPRQLILDLDPCDAPDIDETPVGAAVDLLPEIAERVAHPVSGPVRDIDAQQQQVGGRPLEEVLVMALQEEAAAAEMLPLGRADLNDVLAVADRGLSHEWNRVEAAARLGDLEPIARIQRGVVAE